MNKMDQKCKNKISLFQTTIIRKKYHNLKIMNNKMKEYLTILIKKMKMK